MGMAWCCLIVTYTGVWTGGWAGGSSDERVARHGVDEGTGVDELRRRASGTGEDGRMAWTTMRVRTWAVGRKAWAWHGRGRTGAGTRHGQTDWTGWRMARA